MLELADVSKNDIQQILENPENMIVQENALSNFPSLINYPFTFQAVKWNGELLSYVGGAKRGDSYLIAFYMVVTRELPKGRISSELSVQETIDVVRSNFSPRLNGGGLRQYADWYKKTFRPSISLDIPALKAISSPRIESLSKKVKARTIADKLDDKCDEFRQLLDSTGREEPLHQWLAKKENLIFFGADAEEVKSKIQVGEFVTDFIVKRTSMPYLLVEIETTEKIFNKGGEPSAKFNHACLQVTDWQRRIRTQPSYFREFIGEELYEPEGLVVMGRTQDIDDKIKKDRWRDLQAKANPRPMTFDDLIARVRNFVRLIRDPKNL